MIPSIDRHLAQQIVSTIKDVCSHDINFIDRSGIILASTDPARIGTFHPIGKEAASSGESIEVRENAPQGGAQRGINMPIYYENRLLAVIGITGDPEEVRKYAFLARRITNLLIRERELDSARRQLEDRKHFVIRSLIHNERGNDAYIKRCLKEWEMDPAKDSRIILIRRNASYALQDTPPLDSEIRQLWDQCQIFLHAFDYPGDFLAVIENSKLSSVMEKLQVFSAQHHSVLHVTIGKSVPLYLLHQSYTSALTAIKSRIPSNRCLVLFDDLTLELILSQIPKQSREDFYKKTAASLTSEELELIKAYFEEDMSLASTCKKLYLHKNTLQYRLNHIYQKCGLNPRRFQDAVLLYLAIMLKIND